MISKHRIIVVISYFLSFIIPRSKDILIFGGDKGLRFADNSRYMFIYCSVHTNKKCIWLSHDEKIVERVRARGYRAYLAKEPLGVYYGFRAKWHIFDVALNDTCTFSSRGAYLLNLWHGMPIKNIGKILNPYGKIGQINKKYFFSFANKELQYTILNAFDIAKENMIISNQPRNIVFNISERENEIYETSEEKEILKKLRTIKKQKGKILGYFPTWRDHGVENFMGIENTKELKVLNDLLVMHDAYILTKRHTCSFKEYKHSGYSKQAEINEETIDSLSNILTIGFDIDLNSVITECDILISDYSSVIIDYLLMDKPIVLYIHDLEKFQKGHGLYYDYNEFRFGRQVFSMDELRQTLKEYFENEILFSNEYREYRETLKKRFFDNEECFAPILQVLDRVH